MTDMHISRLETVMEGHCEDKNHTEIINLKTFLLEGLNSGEPVPVTPEFWRVLWERVDAVSKAGVNES